MAVWNLLTVLILKMSQVLLASMLTNRAIEMPSLQNMECVSSTVMFYSARSRVMCLLACLEEITCLSFEYGTEDKHCKLYWCIPHPGQCTTYRQGIKHYRVVQRIPPTPPIPSAYKYEPAINGWYRVDNTYQDWLTAQNICRSEGGHLLVVDSQMTQDWVSALLVGETLWYQIDGNDSDVEGDWRLHNGCPIVWTGWGPNQPNNEGGDQDCNYLNPGENFSWYDEACKILMPFICEIDRP